MVTVSYSLAAKGQKASLLAGGNGAATQQLVVKKGEPGYEDAVAMASVKRNGEAVIDAVRYSGGDSIHMTLWDTVPTLQQILDDVRSLQDRIAKKEAEEHEKEVAKALAEGPSYFKYNDGSGLCRAEMEDPRTNHLLSQATKDVAEYKAGKEAENEANRLLSQRKEAAKKIAETNGKIAMKAWSIEHGSELLKARIEGGFEWQYLARTEYANSVCKGFEKAREGDVEKEDDRDTPTLGEIQQFNAIVEAVGDRGSCELQRRKYDVGDSDGCEKEYIWETECDVDVACPDGFVKTIYLKIDSE